jgi:2-iminoacetate synthase ThiH
MLHSLYAAGMDAESVTSSISEKYGVERNLVLRDLSETINTVNALMKEDYKSASVSTMIDYDPSLIKYPILSEIALTYRCQNRCEFCYASSPYRGKR